MERLFNKYSLKVFLHSDEAIIYEASICAQMFANLLFHHRQGWFGLNIIYEIRIVGKKRMNKLGPFSVVLFCNENRSVSADIFSCSVCMVLDYSKGSEEI